MAARDCELTAGKAYTMRCQLFPVANDLCCENEVLPVANDLCSENQVLISCGE